MSKKKITVQQLLDIMQKELKLTVGCTDPTAIGLAVAASVETYGKHSSFFEESSIIDRLSSIQVTLDKNLFKNASAVGIPQMDGGSIFLAIALGALIHEPSRALMLFDTIGPALASKARSLVESVPITVNVDDSLSEISIIVTIRWQNKETSGACIKGHHDSIRWMSFNDTIVYERPSEHTDDPKKNDEVPLDLEELSKAVSSVNDTELAMLAEGIAINMKASEGTEEKIYGSIEGPAFIMNVLEARNRVSSATRSRMSGQNVKVMSTGGSGNHGLTLFITLYYGWQLDGIVPSRSLLQGALLGVVVLHLIKQETGVLTPMCGCAVSSALAAACATVWGLGGNERHMLQAMNIVLNSLGGVVCDGAKVSCSFKTSLGSQVALESASLAIKGMVIPPSEGLASDSFTSLLENIRRIHQEGMASFDQTMVSIIEKRQRTNKVQ